MGAEPLSRYAARTRGWPGVAALLRGPRELAPADRGPQHPDRSGLVGARLAGELHGTEARQRSRHRLRGAAADRRRAGVALSLRPSRRRDAGAASRGTSAARHHAARQRHHHESARCGDPRRGVRLASAHRARQERRGDSRADAPLVGARPHRPQQGAVGFVRDRDARRADLSRGRIQATATAIIFARRATATARSGSRCCRSAPTSRAGSWATST